MEPILVFAETHTELRRVVKERTRQGYLRLPIFTPMLLNDGRWVDIMFPRHLVH